MIDLHSHILPEIDDGAASWEEFLAMCVASMEDGVTHIVATPHMLPDGKYANRKDDVLPRVAEARRRLMEAGVELKVIAGGEVYLAPTTGDDVKNKQVLTYGDKGKHLLVELPTGEVPMFAERVLFELQLIGVTPILAHPERYFALLDQMERLTDWIERGILLQVNGRSLLGESGDRVKRWAEELLERHMVHFLASDAHGTERRPPGLSQAKERAAQIVGSDMAEALTSRNPMRVLAGEFVPVWEVKKPRRRGLLSRLFGR